MQHLSVNLERACVTVFNMYHVTKNTGLDEIKDEYSISHASFKANFVILVPYTDITDHLLYILLATT